jgi:hypothetical protein
MGSLCRRLLCIWNRYGNETQVLQLVWQPFSSVSAHLLALEVSILVCRRSIVELWTFVFWLSLWYPGTDTRGLRSRIFGDLTAEQVFWPTMLLLHSCIPLPWQAVDQTGTDRLKMAIIVIWPSSDYMTSFGCRTIDGIRSWWIQKHWFLKFWWTHADSSLVQHSALASKLRLLLGTSIGLFALGCLSWLWNPFDATVLWDWNYKQAKAIYQHSCRGGKASSKYHLWRQLAWVPQRILHRSYYKSVWNGLLQRNMKSI